MKLGKIRACSPQPCSGAESNCASVDPGTRANIMEGMAQLCPVEIQGQAASFQTQQGDELMKCSLLSPFKQAWAQIRGSQRKANILPKKRSAADPEGKVRKQGDFPIDLASPGPPMTVLLMPLAKWGLHQCSSSPHRPSGTCYRAVRSCQAQSVTGK